MKSYYLLPALLLLASSLLAQQKTEFGLSANAGNFTLPQKGPDPLGSKHYESNLTGGYSTGLGIYGKRNLTPRWAWSAELRYTLSSFTLHEKFGFDPDGNSIVIVNDWKRRYTEQGLVLPLKLLYHFGAAAKTALGLGVAPSFNLRTRQTVSSAGEDLWAYYRPLLTQYQQQAEPAPRMQLLVVASLHQQIGSRFSVGIECMANPHRNDLGIYFKDYESRTFAARSPFSIHRLSISLRYELITTE